MKLNPQMFRRAAAKRRAAADVLVRHDPPHFTDAVYLAGYAGECILKAVILASTPGSQREALIDEEFRGRRGHDIQSLAGLIRQRIGSLPRNLQLAVKALSGWSTDLRYETSDYDERDAHEFLMRVDEVISWGEGRL